MHGNIFLYKYMWENGSETLATVPTWSHHKGFLHHLHLYVSLGAVQMRN